MKHLSMILLAGTISLAGTARAGDLPTGESIAAGTAIINRSGNVLTVTNSNRAIINWNSFGVGAGNTVQFAQPGPSSKVMNRVLGNDPSQIHGQIGSNGQVFLVNPSGIFVGTTGRIDASGIFLSTGNISNADFLADNLRFEAPPAATPIVISGALTATDLIDIRASSFDGSGAMVNAPNMNIDTGATALPPLPSTGDITVGGGTISTVGGNITIGGDIGITGGGDITIGGGTITTSPGSDITISSRGTITTVGGSITVGGGSATGSVALTAGNLNTQPETQKLLQRTGGAISLRATGAIASAPSAPMPQQTLSLTATPVAPSVPPAASTASVPARGTVPAARLVNTGGLVDGAVTVRMSLVDASPITLR